MLPHRVRHLFFFDILFLCTSSINAICLRFKTELDLIRTEQTRDRIHAKGLVTLILALIGIGELIIGYRLIIVDGIKMYRILIC